MGSGEDRKVRGHCKVELIGLGECGMQGKGGMSQFMAWTSQIRSAREVFSLYSHISLFPLQQAPLTWLEGWKFGFDGLFPLLDCKLHRDRDHARLACCIPITSHIKFSQLSLCMNKCVNE